MRLVNAIVGALVAAAAVFVFTSLTAFWYAYVRGGAREGIDFVWYMLTSGPTLSVCSIAAFLGGGYGFVVTSSERDQEAK